MIADSIQDVPVPTVIDSIQEVAVPNVRGCIVSEFFLQNPQNSKQPTKNLIPKFFSFDV